MNKNRSLFPFSFIFIVFLTFLCVGVYSGDIITQKKDEYNEILNTTKSKTQKLFLQDNMLRIEEERIAVLINLETEEIYQLFPEYKKYYKVDPSILNESEQMQEIINLFTDIEYTVVLKETNAEFNSWTCDIWEISGYNSCLSFKIIIYAADIPAVPSLYLDKIMEIFGVYFNTFQDLFDEFNNITGVTVNTITEIEFMGRIIRNTESYIEFVKSDIPSEKLVIPEDFSELK